MLKKKLLFKEDKSQMNRIKQENEKILKINQPFEDSKRTRGRQLTIKTNNLNQKILLNTIKFTQNENSLGKTSTNLKILEDKSNSKINSNKYQKINGFLSKKYRADSVELDEDYASSDSDCSIRNNRKRELLHDTLELPDKLKYSFRVESLDHSQEITETCEQSDDFAFTYGENNLTNEVERILIDIYNNHVYVNSRKKIDITKYEKHRYKEKIFEIPEIKQIRDRYYEIKASIMGKKSISNEVNENYLNWNNDNSNEEIEKKNSSVHCERISKIKNDEEYYTDHSYYSSCSTKDLSFNESDKSVTKIILIELKKIKKLLIDSSKDIQKVFKLPLSHLKLNNKIVQFNIEEIHKEEFTTTLLRDEFIEALIIQIKTIAKDLKIDDIHHLLSQIEEDYNTQKNEMTRFTAFLFAQLNSCVDNNEYEEDENSKERSNSNTSDQSDQTNNLTKANSQLNSNSKYYTTNNTSFDIYENSSSPCNKVTNDIGIDELVEFIQKPENKKIKKNRKKKKNKKVEPEIEIMNTIEDEEVEKFKKLISENSRHVKFTKKIRPNISQEWLSNITKLVKV